MTFPEDRPDSLPGPRACPRAAMAVLTAMIAFNPAVVRAGLSPESTDGVDTVLQVADALAESSPSQPVEQPPRLDPTGWRRFRHDSTVLTRRFVLRETPDARRVLALALTTGLLYAARRDIRDEIGDHRSTSRTSLYEKGRLISRGVVSPLLAGAFYAARGLTGNPRHAETAQILLESTLYGAALAGAGSFVLAAERPEDGTSVHLLRGKGHGVSLDVALAASVVAPLDRRCLRAYPDDSRTRRLLKLGGRGLLYAALGLTALQRMDADKHWAPDVFLGAAGGLAVGYSICSAHDADHGGANATSASRPSLRVMPGRLALAWSY